MEVHPPLKRLVSLEEHLLHELKPIKVRNHQSRKPKTGVPEEKITLDPWSEEEFVLEDSHSYIRDIVTGQSNEQTRRTSS